MGNCETGERGSTIGCQIRGDALGGTMIDVAAGGGSLKPTKMN